jgi:MipA family protein
VICVKRVLQARPVAVMGVAMCCVCCPVLANAQSIGPSNPLFTPVPASGWIMTLGASGQVGPKYDGSNTRGLTGMPSISWRRVGEPATFSAPEDSMSLPLYETGQFGIGPVVNYRAGRYSGSDVKLARLNDVPWTIEAGVYAEFWPLKDRLRTRLEVRQGFHGHHGVVVDLSADWVEKLGGFTLSGGPRLSLADTPFMRKNFGVTPTEAALNRNIFAYAPGGYDPKGGVRSAGAGAALAYEWSPSWTTTTFAKYERIVSDAAKSPIVRVIGQQNQFTFGVGAAYSFKID